MIFDDDLDDIDDDLSDDFILTRINLNIDEDEEHEPQAATKNDITFGSGTCWHCGGKGYSTWISSGTKERCWYCSGSGVS